MKMSLLSAGPVVVVSLVANLGFAQTGSSRVDAPASGSPPASSVNPVQARLMAALLPSKGGGQAAGQVTFLPADDQVVMSGVFTGLEPNRRYQLVLEPLAPPVPKPQTPGADMNPPPGAAGAVRIPPGEDLGMLIPDANGSANVQKTFHLADLVKVPDGLAGRTLSIRRAPPLNAPDDRPLVASGEITAALVPAVPPP